SSQTSMGGRAWSPSGDTADTMQFFVARADSAVALNASEPSHVVSACEGNHATADVSGAGFQQAYWTLDPATSALTASLAAAPASPQDTRLVLTRADLPLELEATLTQLAR